MLSKRELLILKNHQETINIQLFLNSNHLENNIYVLKWIDRRTLHKAQCVMSRVPSKAVDNIINIGLFNNIYIILKVLFNCEKLEYHIVDIVFDCILTIRIISLSIYIWKTPRNYTIMRVYVMMNIS